MNTLLHQAAAQAKTVWLEKALITLLPQVWNLTIESPSWQKSALDWTTQIERLFEEKKLSTPSQQKNRRTDIANALRTINPQHPLIPFVLLPSEIYAAMNNEQASRLNDRTSKFFSTQQADELVEKATSLLDSSNPNEVAAGLAVLTGRRISEILISLFRPKTAYSLLFSQAVKRRGQVDLEFEVPTLAAADSVLGAIEHLKQIWNIQELKALNLPNNHLRQRINAKYSGVPDACRKHFADLVPGREAQTDNGSRLYTHLFRAVYAEIATYYYKPSWVPDHRFKAEIQGHFKLAEDGQRIPNYSARQNYDDYLICDRSPANSGIKLNLPTVQILEVFQRNSSIEKEIEANNEEGMIINRRLESATINALLYRAVDRLLFSQHWIEALTGLVFLTGRKVQTLLEVTPKPKTQFSILVDGLEVPTLTGAPQVTAAWIKFAQLSPLPEQEVEGVVQEVCSRTFEDLVALQSVQDLRAVYSAIALHWFCPSQAREDVFLSTIGAAETAGFETVNSERGIKLQQRNVAILDSLNKVAEAKELPVESEEPNSTQDESKPKSRQRRKALSVDVELLRAAAATLGIKIRDKGVGGVSYDAALSQLLSQLAQGKAAQPSSTHTESEGEKEAISALKDQAKTLAWLTNRLEVLEHHVEQLQHERDEAIARVNLEINSAQLEVLRQENERLKQERDQATSKLQAFRQLLIGSGEQEDEAVQESQHVSAPPAISSDTKPKSPKASYKRTSEEDALFHIRRAIQAIMHFNDEEAGSFDNMWYISFPVVQALLRAHGFPANQKTVSTVFDELKLELESHHDKHKLGSRHNRRHPNIKLIADKIHRHNLQIPL